MSDEPRDDEIEETRELRALAEARSALENVEREHGRIFSQLSRWRQRYERLEEGLREDALVFSFDRHGTLEEVAGPIEKRLGHTLPELVAGFNDFADDATASVVHAAVTKALGGSAESVIVAGTIRGSNDEQYAFDFIVLPVADDNDGVASVDVLARVGGPVPGGGAAPNEDEDFDLFMEATSKRLLDEPSSNAIDESLAGLGQFFNLDRVAVNGYDDNEKVFSSSASWTRAGVEPLKVETSGISISKLPWAYALLTAGEAVVISGGAELPPEASAEKSLYTDAGVKSTILVPVVYNDSLAGFVSLQSVAEDRSWPDPEVLLVRRFVATLAASLARTALVEELDRATAEAEEAKAEAEAATHQLADAKATAEEATGQLGAAKAAAAEAGRELEETREQAEVAQRRAEDTAADTLQVRAQLDQARAEIDEARHDAADVRAKLAEAERALAEAERALAEAGIGTAAVEPSAPEPLPDLGAEDVAPLPPLDVRNLSTPEVADFAVSADAAPDFDIAFPDDEQEDIVVGETAAPQPDAEEGSEEEEPEADEATDVRPYLDPVGPADEVDPSEAQTGEVPLLADEIEAVVPDPVAELDVDSGDAEQEEADAQALDGAATRAFDPDATVEMPVPEYDPDATFEIEEVDRPADHDTPIDEPESGEADLPRALDLDEILERTQGGSKPESEAPVEEIEETIEVPPSRFLDDVQEEPDAESTDDEDDAVIARDLEAARQLAKQVAGKDAEPETLEEATGERDALAEESIEPPEAPVESAFPGLDTVAGVSEIAGNADLYRNMLIKFRQDYKSAPEKIGRAIEKGNTEVAYLLLHAIKGVAGVLGAAEVRDHAEALEAALMAQDTAATEQALTLFSEALTVVIQSIDRIEAGADLNTGPAPGEVEPHVSDPKVLRTYLEGLRQHLHSEKRKQCQFVIREITVRTWPAKFNEGVDRLAKRVRADQFEEARNEFNALMAKLT